MADDPKTQAPALTPSHRGGRNRARLLQALREPCGNRCHLRTLCRRQPQEQTEVQETRTGDMTES